MTAPRPYEAVPYDDFPVTETHLDGLCMTARKAGLDATSPERATVLELGCAHAVNLMPMAVHLPRARFVGVDLSPGQIERARQRLATIELPNLELRCADVMELGLGEQRFDYIIAHGLYSWVPEPVRVRILELCRQHLSPCGVAYISYNAMPAWGVRGAIRRALLEGVAGITEPSQQVLRARAVLARLEAIQPLRGTAEGALLSAEIVALRDKTDAYLLHEYLVPHARAFYLREVVERAAAADLRWLGDVAPTGLRPSTERDTRCQLRAISDDDLVIEQLADVLEFRQFRASLLGRGDAPRGPRPSPLALLSGTHLSASPSAVEGHDGIERAVLEQLAARWPGDESFAALAEAMGLEPQTLAETLAPLVEDQRIEVRPRALPIGTLGPHPRVSVVSRLEASVLTFVTTPRHEHAPLDAFHAALVRQLEGTRNRHGIVEGLIDDIQQGRLQLAGGEPPPLEQLRAALPGLVDAGLERLLGVGLLLPDPA